MKRCLRLEGSKQKVKLGNTNKASIKDKYEKSYLILHLISISFP
jgi:hypothetical protein